MAASALGFLWRRYGVFHTYYLLPLVMATMATRVFLSAHTVSAVLAGALLGFVLAYVMTTPRQPMVKV
jgi:membrane-associated phospholipid phosphatase